MKRNINSKDMPLFVTGGAGFIGSNFVRMVSELWPHSEVIVGDMLTYAGNIANISDLTEDEKIKFIKMDISSQDDVRKIFDEFSPVRVVNFAAESHVDRSIMDASAFIDTNIKGTYNLIEAARSHWLDENNSYSEENLFIQISTDEVYGSLDSGKFTETSTLMPNSPYSASKASSDLLVRSYIKTHNFPACITRSSNNYGPYQFPEKLIPLMINNIINGRKIPIYGDGKNIRDWIYVEDNCKAIAEVLMRGDPGEIYNIGGLNERKNIDVAHMVIDIIRKLVESGDESFKEYNLKAEDINDDILIYVTDRPGHDRRYALDVSKIKKHLGWSPQTDFADGLERTVKWYLHNKAWVDGVTSGEYMKYYEKMYGGRERVS